MRVAVLAGDAPHHRALCARLAERVDVACVVLSHNRVGPSSRFRRARFAVVTRTAGAPLLNAWRDAMDSFGESAARAPAPNAVVSEINEQATIDALIAAEPDLVVVSGTNLVRGALLDRVVARGALNLHTGLSPYVRGGPNCTNWCLAEGAFHLIGVTVHRLDAGVDAGPIVASASTPVTGRETLAELQRAVISHGHDLLVAAVERIAAGRDVPSVPQSDLGVAGRTYFSREWTRSAMRRAAANFERRWRPEVVAAGLVASRRAALRCVALG
jgi:methionyl-tRNA formyltransferase